ncbi:MAG: hypothetical protein EU518_02035 [Promethearchaeota archaeon]|nr:MAG: hypothetical protein EU518_02035 [Candidatus Lokiarchaeota archaeon]
MDSPDKRELRYNLIKFSNLLKNSESIYKDFLINSKIKKNKLCFSLREKKKYKRRIYLREIKLTICPKPEFYTIKSFEIHNHQKDGEFPNLLYSIKIEGNNNQAEIFKNLEDIILGKDQKIFHSHHPFSI